MEFKVRSEGHAVGLKMGLYETQHGALRQGSLEADDGWRVVCRSLRSRAGYAALRSELASPDSDVTVFDGQCRFQKTDCERHRRRVGYESRERQLQRPSGLSHFRRVNL